MLFLPLKMNPIQVNTNTMDNIIQTGSIVSLQLPGKIHDAYSHAQVIEKTDKYWVAKLVVHRTMTRAITPTQYEITHFPGPRSNIIIHLWNFPATRKGEQIRARKEPCGLKGIVQIPPESRMILEAQCGKIESWDMYWLPWDNQPYVTTSYCD
jgi:hypothetical protein